MKVENMLSNKGNKIANQFILKDLPEFISKDGIKIRSGDSFQSYESMIAHIDHNGKIYLDENYWDYSRTTSKYLYMFTGMNKKDLISGIDSGDIILCDLN